jgi:hypothetical protein
MASTSAGAPPPRFESCMSSTAMLRVLERQRVQLDLVLCGSGVPTHLRLDTMRVAASMLASRCAHCVVYCCRCVCPQ